MSINEILRRDKVSIEHVLEERMHQVFVVTPILADLFQTHKLFDGRVLVDQLDDLGLDFVLLGECVQHARSLQRSTLEHNLDEIVHVGVGQLVAVGLVGHE